MLAPVAMLTPGGGADPRRPHRRAPARGRCRRAGLSPAADSAGSGPAPPGGPRARRPTVDSWCVPQENSVVTRNNECCLTSCRYFCSWMQASFAKSINILTARQVTAPSPALRSLPFLPASPSKHFDGPAWRTQTGVCQFRPTAEATKLASPGKGS